MTLIDDDKIIKMNIASVCNTDGKADNYGHRII